MFINRSLNEKLIGQTNADKPSPLVVFPTGTTGSFHGVSKSSREDGRRVRKVRGAYTRRQGDATAAGASTLKSSLLINFGLQRCRNDAASVRVPWFVSLPETSSSVSQGTWQGGYQELNSLWPANGPLMVFTYGDTLYLLICRSPAAAAFRCQKSARREKNLMCLERKEFRRQLHMFQKWQTENTVLRERAKLREMQVPKPPRPTDASTAVVEDGMHLVPSCQLLCRHHRFTGTQPYRNFSWVLAFKVPLLALRVL